MINKLGEILENFAGDPNHTHCFNHVVTLIVKKMTHQFDVPKGEADVVLNEAEKELRNLAEGIDIEEMLTRSMQDVGIEDKDDEENKEDGTEDEKLPEDCATLDVSTRPVQLVLVKVGSFVPDGAVHLN